MKVALPEKWLDKVNEDDRARDAAVKALDNRLRVVFKLLPYAAEKADGDQEYIHQLRVWTRRATAALTVYGDLIPHRKYSWMKKQLKNIKLAANSARDCDNLINRLGAEKELPEIKQRLREIQNEREVAQKEVVAVNERLSRHHHGTRRVDKLLQKLRSHGDKSGDPGKTSYPDWARKQLCQFIEKFFQAVPDEKSDVTAMHQFRIRSKKLRYAMELLPNAFPAEFRQDLYPVIESMQDRLGEINDLVLTIARLQRCLESMAEEDAAAWQDLIEREQSRLNLMRWTFWEWCSQEKLQHLREEFDLLLKSPRSSRELEAVIESDDSD